MEKEADITMLIVIFWEFAKEPKLQKRKCISYCLKPRNKAFWNILLCQRTPAPFFAFYRMNYWVCECIFLYKCLISLPNYCSTILNVYKYIIICAMEKAVRRRPPTEKGQHQCQAIPCRIMVEKSGMIPVFLPSTWSFPCHCHSTNNPHSVIRPPSTLYNPSNWCR